MVKSTNRSLLKGLIFPTTEKGARSSILPLTSTLAVVWRSEDKPAIVPLKALIAKLQWGWSERSEKWKEALLRTRAANFTGISGVGATGALVTEMDSFVPGWGVRFARM